MSQVAKNATADIASMTQEAQQTNDVRRLRVLLEKADWMVSSRVFYHFALIDLIDLHTAWVLEQLAKNLLMYINAALMD